MNTIEKLDFTTILEKLANRASSPGGKERALSLLPMTDKDAVERAQKQTAAAFTRSIRLSAPAFGIAASIDTALDRLAIGAALNPAELLQIARFLHVCSKAKKYGRSSIADDDQDILTPLFSRLASLKTLADEIERCIPAEDEISDDASSDLKKIRRQIFQTGEKVHSTLTSMAHGSYKDYLQDSLITMRKDRYCLPVKLEYKSQVPGITHDQSSSGSTLFIEPMAVVQLGNKITELKNDEQIEINRILAALSQDVAVHLDEIRSSEESLTDLDFIFAKAALAIDMNGSRPEFNEDGILELKNARHPLLDPTAVVPITLKLGDEYDQLVITGPNTGGKTVTLKTAGLLSMMGQAGLRIPAGEHSRLPVFSEVFADIGDDQAIDQNLSTFSSHMKNLLDILNKVDEHSLVLLDELGAGTDPAEGSSLARSILEWFHARKIRTIATTHYTELKEYAYNTGGVQNASCEFDVETLRPTYRLLIGIPGKSNALAIAGRLGIPEDIIEQARSQMSHPVRSMESLLADLEAQKRDLEKQQAEMVEERKEIERLERKLEHTRSSIAGQKEHILSEAREKAHDMLKEAKKTSDEAIRMGRKAAGGRPMSARDMEKTRDKVRENLKSLEEKPKKKRGKKSAEPTPAYKPLTEAAVGDYVHVRSMGMDGVITAGPDNKGVYTVRVGSFTSQAKLKDLATPSSPPPQETPEKSSRARYSGIAKSATVRSEINLIGQDVATAIASLDKYLDDAYLAKLETVRIVHGKGTGALRKGVADHLKHVPYVKSFRAGQFGEGDAGVTIVTFR